MQVPRFGADEIETVLYVGAGLVTVGTPIWLMRRHVGALTDEAIAEVTWPYFWYRVHRPPLRMFLRLASCAPRALIKRPALGKSRAIAPGGVRPVERERESRFEVHPRADRTEAVGQYYRMYLDNNLLVPLALAGDYAGDTRQNLMYALASRLTGEACSSAAEEFRTGDLHERKQVALHSEQFELFETLDRDERLELMFVRELANITKAFAAGAGSNSTLDSEIVKLVDSFSKWISPQEPGRDPGPYVFSGEFGKFAVIKMSRDRAQRDGFEGFQTRFQQAVTVGARNVYLLFRGTKDEISDLQNSLRHARYLRHKPISFSSRGSKPARFDGRGAPMYAATYVVPTQ